MKRQKQRQKQATKAKTCSKTRQQVDQDAENNKNTDNNADVGHSAFSAPLFCSFASGALFLGFLVPITPRFDPLTPCTNLSGPFNHGFSSSLLYFSLYFHLSPFSFIHSAGSGDVPHQDLDAHTRYSTPPSRSLMQVFRVSC